MHLQIAAVRFPVGTAKGWISQDPQHLGAAQEVSAQATTTLDVSPALTAGYRRVDRRRAASLQNFANDSRRTGTDASNPGKRPVVFNEFRELGFEREDCGRRALVSKHLRL